MDAPITDPPTPGPPILDLRGLRCPLPVLRTAKRLGAMRPGERLWVETTDPLAGLDLPHFAAQSGHRLLGTERTGWGCRFLFERGAEAAPLERGGR